MDQGTTRLVDTTRAVDAAGSPPRVQKLGDEIEEVRGRLDALADELDRRRHAALDWRLQLRRHALGLTMTALAVVVIAAGVAWRGRVLSAIPRRRRSRRG
jgi:hypothetical protein